MIYKITPMIYKITKSKEDIEEQVYIQYND